VDSSYVTTRRKPLATLLALLILPAVLLLAISLSRIVYPFDAGNYEALVWDSALLSAQGRNPYTHALQPPFVVAPYGYLYYLLIGWGLKLCGLQLWVGRVLSLVGMLACGWGVARIVGVLTRRPVAGVVAVAVVLTSWPVAVWSSLQRPDFVALGFAYAGLALLFRDDVERPADWRATLAATLLFAAAFLCKMTIVLPFLVGAARLYQTGRRREAFGVFLGTVALIGTAMLLLNATSGGGYFWQQFEVLGHVKASLRVAGRWLRALLTAPSTWVALVVLGAGAGATRRTEGRSAFALVGGYLVASLALAFYTSMRGGSNVNYYLEATLALGLAAGVAVARTPRLSERAGLIVLALALTGSVQLVRLGRGEYFRWKSLPYYRELVQTVAKNTPPGALCVSTNPDLVAAAGRTFHFADFMFYDELAPSGTLRDLFNEAIRSRRYSAFIWGKDDARFPGYRYVPMRTPLPDRYYPLYLYLREDLVPPRSR